MKSIMPLTSMTKCYKTLPSYFADKVTQQMRKRRDESTEEQVDNEVKEVCSRRSPALSTRDRPPSRMSDRVLMTKRSCTPLVAVSDNESEDGSTPRDGTGGDTQRSNSSAGSKRESPRPTTAGYFASTLNYIRRKTPTSPRTAVSLDTVDLWEEEDSDCEERRPSPGFDKIDGVPINPRMTLDFSELRRSRSPVATKRNKMDDSATYVNHIPKPVATKTLAEMRADMAAAKTRLLESRNKPRVRANRKLQAMTLFPNPDRSGDGRPTNHKSRTEAAEIKELRSPIEKQKSSSTKFQFMPRLSNTYTITESKPTISPSPAATQVKASELNRINSKISALKSVNTNTKIHRNPKNLTVNTAQNCAPVREDFRRVKDVDARGSTDSNMSTGSSGSSPDRKVKFNNFVTVREGEMNTLDYLRESNNSAQVFKQKYLGNNADNKSVKTTDRGSSGNIAQGALRIELLC